MKDMVTIAKAAKQIHSKRQTIMVWRFIAELTVECVLYIMHEVKSCNILHKGIVIIPSLFLLLPVFRYQKTTQQQLLLRLQQKH